MLLKTIFVDGICSYASYATVWLWGGKVLQRFGIQWCLVLFRWVQSNLHRGEGAPLQGMSNIVESWCGWCLSWLRLSDSQKKPKRFFLFIDGVSNSVLVDFRSAMRKRSKQILSLRRWKRHCYPLNVNNYALLEESRDITSFPAAILTGAECHCPAAPSVVQRKTWTY